MTTTGEFLMQMNWLKGGLEINPEDYLKYPDGAGGVS
jgi:hypothetical protein